MRWAQSGSQLVRLRKFAESYDCAPRGAVETFRPSSSERPTRQSCLSRRRGDRRYRGREVAGQSHIPQGPTTRSVREPFGVDHESLREVLTSLTGSLSSKLL